MPNKTGVKPGNAARLALVMCAVAGIGAMAVHANAEVTYTYWHTSNQKAAPTVQGVLSKPWRMEKIVRCSETDTSVKTWNCTQTDALRGRRGSKSFQYVFTPLCDRTPPGTPFNKASMTFRTASSSNPDLSCKWQTANNTNDYKCVNKSKATETVTVAWACSAP